MAIINMYAFWFKDTANIEVEFSQLLRLQIALVNSDG